MVPGQASVLDYFWAFRAAHLSRQLGSLGQILIDEPTASRVCSHIPSFFTSVLTGVKIVKQKRCCG